MPGNHLRIATVVERPVYEAIHCLANRDGVSLPEKVRALILDALEFTENAALEALVNARRRSSARSHSLSKVRRRLKIG